MAKNPDAKQELLLWGYMREVERIYKIRNIPHEINNIIYLYLKICDKWSRKYSSNYIKINECNTLINVEGNVTHTAFGEMVVSEGVFVWRIQILALVHDGSYLEAPFIGIIEDDEGKLEFYRDSDIWGYCGYQLCAGDTGQLFCYMDYKQGTPKHIETEDYRCEWKEDGDILEMTLDLNKRTLSFKVNDKDFGVAYSNIKQTSYRLALSMEKFEGSQFEFL